MNTLNRPVVVGVVDKQPSALSFAIAQARATRSPLRVIHSAGFPSQMAEMYAGAALIEDLRADGQQVLDNARRFVEERAPELEAGFVLTSVPPLQALEDVAEDARVIVLGTDDIPWYERLLRTQVSGHLALHAPCPVVVVPELAYPGRFDGDIVLTLDGDTLADGPIRFAFEEASVHDRTLHVLHAAPPGTLSSDSEEIRANIAEVLAGWHERYPDVVVLPAFAAGDARAMIMRATERAGLVVVGRPHGHSMPFAVARPLAAQVLRGAHCPVAVVPASYPGG